MRLAALKDAQAGWLVDDVLILKADVAMDPKDKPALTSECVPGDLVLNLPSGAKLDAYWLLMRMTSEVFRTSPAGDAISVDGSLGAWTYILMWMHPQHEEPPLTLGGAYTLLPVAHKYGFIKLVARAVDVVKGHPLFPHHSLPSTYIISWLSLAEDLQLDALQDKCWSSLRGWTGKQVAAALMNDCDNVPGVRSQVKNLPPDTIFRLMGLLAQKA
mmetsp:Transcript_17571/g.52811  ORF Transcript_17571/g.52811 Transcript_17571/m.52811 type:complete len:215 (-) Transcript_17571:209-853(-)